MYFSGAHTLPPPAGGGYQYQQSQPFGGSAAGGFSMGAAAAEDSDDYFSDGYDEMSDGDDNAAPFARPPHAGRARSSPYVVVCHETVGEP